MVCTHTLTGGDTAADFAYVRLQPAFYTWHVRLRLNKFLCFVVWYQYSHFQFDIVVSGTSDTQPNKCNYAQLGDPLHKAHHCVGICLVMHDGLIMQFLDTLLF